MFTPNVEDSLIPYAGTYLEVQYFFLKEHAFDEQ
jgi:hypothetical protein